MITASDAARELARQRWGSTKIDRLISELSARADELEADQLEQLSEVVAKSLHAGGER